MSSRNLNLKYSKVQYSLSIINHYIRVKSHFQNYNQREHNYQFNHLNTRFFIDFLILDEGVTIDSTLKIKINSNVFDSLKCTNYDYNHI